MLGCDCSSGDAATDLVHMGLPSPDTGGLNGYSHAVLDVDLPEDSEVFIVFQDNTSNDGALFHDVMEASGEIELYIGLSPTGGGP